MTLLALLDARPRFLGAKGGEPTPFVLPRGIVLLIAGLTDIASGWTECAPLLFRKQQLLIEVLTVLLDVLPLTILGFDTDTDTVFINETVKAWCEAADVTFTRSRPYRKNHQAHVDQKNGAVVRRMVGYRRFEGLTATQALARVYRPMRLFMNFFQPSFKLAGKGRNGAMRNGIAEEPELLKKQPCTYAGCDIYPPTSAASNRS